MKPLPPQYDPKQVEDKIYAFWQKNDLFNPDKQPNVDSKKQPFSIIMPPPNANGSLHLGHAVFVTLEDIMVRYHRMLGHPTLWLPGADHAGFETQVVFEKKLEKEGKSRFQIERNELYQMIWDFTQSNKIHMEDQLKRLGASCDWSREKFTLDKDIIKIVYKTFKKLYDDGLVYYGDRPVNWCTKHQTSLSDLEVKSVEQTDSLYYVKYGPITIATTRPETMFADVAVAVNPNDRKYKKYIGKKIILPLTNREILIIADKEVDPKFGTGALKITPAHDALDFEIGQRHNLEVLTVVDERGKLTDLAGEFSGLKVLEAREKVVAKLDKEGYLVKTDAAYNHTVSRCYKCNNIIEPRILKQWFVKMEKLAKLGLDAVKDKEVEFVDKRFEKIYKHWLANIRDWNISRQIVWGIQIPVWYCQNSIGNKHNVKFKEKMGIASDVVPQIFDNKTCTYRLRDHKLKVGNWVILENSATGDIFGTAQITQSTKTTVGKLDLQNKRHWKTYNKVDELIAAFQRHYPDKKIDLDTPAYIYVYRFQKSCPPIITDGSIPKVCPHCGSKVLVQDTDVFDTWFSSGQWPFATLMTSGRAKLKVKGEKLKVSDDFNNFYPTSVMETGWDILFFWVARMIMLGKYLTGKVPFKKVYLHGLVRDKDRQKMSKSKGNVIDPLGVAEIYGTDAVRMALVFGLSSGSDIVISEEKIKGMRNFVTKIWNASRFVMSQLEDFKERKTYVYSKKDEETFKKLDLIIKETNHNYSRYKFGIAAEKLYQFFWHEFCDDILEDCKKRIYESTIQEDKLAAQSVLLEVLVTSLKLLHPIMPFVTEEIWQNLLQVTCYKLHGKSIMISEWPFTKK